MPGFLCFPNQLVEDIISLGLSGSDTVAVRFIPAAPPGLYLRPCRVYTCDPAGPLSQRSILFQREHGVFEIGLLEQFQFFIDIKEHVFIGGAPAKLIGRTIGDHEELQGIAF